MRNRIALALTSLGLLTMLLALFEPQLRSAVATIWELGDVFAGVSSGNYLVYSSAGASKGTINNGTSGYTTGCAFNSSATQLYTTDFSGGRVVKFADADPHDSSSFSTTGQTSPESFAFKKDGGYLVGGPRAAVILEYDAADNLIASYPVAATDQTGGTDWVDLAINQTTIFYTGEGRIIKRYDTVLGQLSDFATLPGSGYAYAFRLLPPFDGSGGLIVADSYNVKRLDASGNVIQTYSVSGVSDFFALNLDPDGTTFWTGGITSGVLYRFDIATGGADNYIQTINTASGGYLYGVCLKGEITGGSATSCIDPPADMVAWWPGDGNAADIVGANRGTLQGGTTFAAGKVDQAFSLDGINDFINVPDSPSLNFGTSDFTVDVWVNFRDLSGEQVLVEKYIETFSSAATGWSLTKLSDNRIRFGTSGEEQITSASPLPIVTDTWNHFAARRSAGTISIFLNGNIVATGISTVNVSSSSSVKFGHRGDPNDTPGSTDTREFYLFGYIDEVEIFNRALTDEEIMSIFAANSYGKCKPQQSDVNGAFVNKNETFVQTSTADPTPENGVPFQLVVGVDATAPNNITSASFTPAGGPATALTSTDGVEFNFFSANFSNLTSFNAAFPNGDYTFDIRTAHAPFELTPIISITGDLYPDMPKILNTNWSSGALQIDHPAQDFTFQWSDFCASCVAMPTRAAGQSGPVTDTAYITLRVADTLDNVVLEQSLAADATSFLMPANTLQQGQTYHAQLQFASLEDRNENGVQLGAQYATITKFDIITSTPTPNVCFNGHRYMLTAVPESWTQAEAEAISKGGHLVAINNVTEQNFLVNTFLTGDFLLQPLWIGLTDQRTEGRFLWTTIVGTGRRATNAPLTYSNWNRSTHEPNDCCNTKIKHEEDYVAMNWHYARNLIDPIGSWNDVPNTGTLLDGKAHGPYFGIIEVPNCAAP